MMINNCISFTYYLIYFTFFLIVTFRSLAAETCEELFTANAPRIDLALNGVEVFMNASGSHHQLRKLNLRIDSIRNATKTCGGVYMYANQQGCDGGRLYYGTSKWLLFC
jgi:NAD+ synthase (glutamine-hydrolysing)